MTQSNEKCQIQYGVVPICVVLGRHLNSSMCFYSDCISFHCLQLEEIGGLFYVFAQEFFNTLKEQTDIELENIVYFRDETHYFVMTAKKSSLLKRQVLKQVSKKSHPTNNDDNKPLLDMYRGIYSSCSFRNYRFFSYFWHINRPIIEAHQPTIKTTHNADQTYKGWGHLSM